MELFNEHGDSVGFTDDTFQGTLGPGDACPVCEENMATGEVPVLETQYFWTHPHEAPAHEVEVAECPQCGFKVVTA